MRDTGLTSTICIIIIRSSMHSCIKMVRSAASHSPPQRTVNSKLWNVV